MRFASKYFTNNQKDPKHNPSTKSCLIRVPETINSKYNFKVEIRQKWDGKEANASVIVPYFRDNLMQRKSEHEKRTIDKVSNIHINKIGWIEKLLETPLADNRKYCLWKILIPYLANIKKLPKYEIVPILIEWLDKCDRIKSIDFRSQSRIEDNLRNVKNYLPISFDNLKDDNFELYKTLKR
jgi:Primase X